MNKKQEAIYFFDKYRKDPKSNNFDFVSDLIRMAFDSVDEQISFDERISLFFSVPVDSQMDLLAMLGHYSSDHHKNTEVMPLLKRLHADVRLSDAMRLYFQWLIDVHHFPISI